MKKEELIEVLNQLFWRSHLDKENYQSAIEEADLLLNEINKRSNETKAVRQNEIKQEFCYCIAPSLDLGRTHCCNCGYRLFN